MTGRRVQRPGALSAGFATGEPVAIRAIYRRYAQLVYSVCYQVLGDGDLAAEATREAFVHAWKSLPGSGCDDELGQWLGALAHRVAIELSQRAGRHRTDRQQDIPAPGRAAGSGSGGRQFDIWQVRQALNHLSEADRELLRWQHRREPAYRQSADRPGRPAGSITSESLHAHRRLVEQLHRGP